MLSQGRLNDAKENFGKAVERDPSLLEAHLSLGNILAAEGERDQALRHLQQAARSHDQAVRQAALESLAKLGDQK